MIKAFAFMLTIDRILGENHMFMNMIPYNVKIEMSMIL